MGLKIKRNLFLTLIFVCVLFLFPQMTKAEASNPKFIQISSETAGHVLLLKSDGTVWAWGQNGKGQLGDGTTTFRSTLVQVQGLPKIKQVLASMEFSAAVAENGDVYTWGDNQEGQSGQWEVKAVKTPTFLMSDVVSITSPNRHDTLALKTDGSIWGWGFDAAGPNPADIFGLAPTNAYAPIEYTPNHQFVSLTRNFLKAPDGEVVQYFAQNRGYLQHPELNNQRVVGADWSYILLGDGTIYRWKTQTSFVRFSKMSNFTAFKGGDPFGALDIEGNLWLWGRNGSGQLGNGKDESSNAPNPNETVPYQAFTKVLDFAVTNGATYAIRSDGTVWGWGRFPTDNMKSSLNRQLKPKLLFDATGDLHILTPSQPYGDLKGSTYETVIRGLLAKGIINGYQDNTFRPTDLITCEEFVQWLVMAMGWPHSQKTNAYGDNLPQDHWSNPYIASALQQGVLRLDESLDADDKLTRIDIAIMAARAFKLKGEASKKKITDQDPYWPHPGLAQAALNKGIVQLDSKGAFHPYTDVTRADAAFIINRILQVKE